MKRSIFCDYSIKKIVQAYANRRISPVEIARHTIECIKENDSYYHAWVCFDPEKFLNQAKESERRIFKGFKMRPLEGIPFGIKDIVNTRDFPTRMGSPIWKNFTPGNDARVVFNIRRAGACIPGKTETAELAVCTLCNTINPHDASFTPGTSSSGSAVAIATGMVPAALGTQTAGSIIRPASFCGVYGVKPSFGLVPRTGILKTTDSFDTVGFFTFHLEDIQDIFKAVIVDGSNYPFSDSALKDIKRQNLPTDRPCVVGIIKTHTWQYAPLQTQQAFLSWAKKLSYLNKIEVQIIDDEELLQNAHQIHETIYNRDLAYYFKDEFECGGLVSTNMRNLISKGLKVSVDEYKLALEKQEVLIDTVDKLFDTYDIVISLSTSGPAPKCDILEKPDPSLIWTMTYVPVVNVPLFVSTKGLPFGVQIICKRFNDLKLFKFIHYLRECEIIPKSVNPLIFDKKSFEEKSFEEKSFVKDAAVLD